MQKTQIYFPDEELETLRAIALRQGRPVSELVREAVRATWLRQPEREETGPVALWEGPFRGCSSDHDAAFDEL